MKKLYKISIVFIGLLMLLSSESNAQSAIVAKGVTFNIPGATSTYITCTNDSNDFGGYYVIGTVAHGFYYDAQAVDTILVDYPGATNTWVYGINNSNVVVGTYNTTGDNTDNEGFKFTKATNTWENLTTSWIPSMDITIARDINDANCVVGDYKQSTTHVCFSMCGGTNEPFHYNYLPSYVYHLSNTGRAAGFWIDGSNNNGFIREPGGSFTTLNYPGATRTRLTGVNDSNMIVGTFNLTRSFVYNQGVFKELVKSGSSDFQVQDVNNYGFVVGYYKNSSNNYSGFYMPMCDIGFRPNPNGWQFNNSDANLWPHSYYSQIDYSSDPYRYGQAPFPTLNINGVPTIVQNFLFPDWKLFVETFGEQSCYTVSNNIPVIKNAVFHKWYALTDNWGGSCFGFTASSFMAWDSMPRFKWNFPNVDPWNDYTYIYQIPINYHSRHCINQLQLKQSQRKYIRYYNQNANVSPNEALKKIKVRLLDADNDEGGLVFFNQNPGGGGHIVCPYKVEIDTLDPNIEYIYVYDNNQPNDTTRRVKVDKVKNSWYYNLSGNAAITESEWGGDHAHKGMYMFMPSSNLYDQSIYDSLAKQEFFGSEKNNTFEIYNSSGSNFIINDQSGNTTSFVNDVLINDIPGAEPMFSFVGNEPPYGYLLNENLYNIEMKDFSDSLVSLSLMTDNDSYIYSRGNALLPQKDKFQIDANGIKLINNDNITKIINISSINTDNGNEKTFNLTQVPLHTNSNLTFNIIANDKLKIINQGITTRYNLHIQYLSSLGTGQFDHDSIDIDANTTHIIAMNWANIQNADVCIYIDNGNNGLNDDTLCFSNQGIPVLVANPTQIQETAALNTDTVFIGNIGSGTMPWTVASDATGWLTITGGNTGSNFGNIRYSVTANTGAERTGHITITSAGATNSPFVIEVKQAGVLNVPANVTASDGTFSDGVHVSWDALSGATHYKVYRSSVSGDNGTALTGWITATTYTDNTANGGDFYYYSVKAAQNASGLNESGFSAIDDGYRSCFTADFTSSGTCVGQPTLFTDMSSVHTAAYYLWDIDNNGSIDYTGNNISHTFTSAGSKTVKLIVTDSSLCTNNIIKNISILAFPTVNLPIDTAICANQSVTLNAGSGFSSYLWSTGATTSTVTVDSTGYGLGATPVYVSVTNSNGCAKIDTTVITWNICTEITTEQLKDFAVNIYPNPTNTLLNVSVEGNINELTIDLYNFNGQIVYSDKISEIYGHHTTVLDTKQFKQGIYFLRCVSENRVDVKKVIIY